MFFHHFDLTRLVLFTLFSTVSDLFMQHNNPRHEIKFDLLQQLPTTLLLSWSNLQFLTQIHPNLSFDLLDLTIDLLVFLLQNL